MGRVKDALEEGILWYGMDQKKTEEEGQPFTEWDWKDLLLRDEHGRYVGFEDD